VREEPASELREPSSCDLRERVHRPPRTPPVTAPPTRFGQHRACEELKALVRPAVDPLGHAEPGRAAERELGRVR